jgi:hypothetical protein
MNFSSRTLTRVSGETQLEPCRVAADSHHALPAEDATSAVQPSTTWRTASLGSTVELHVVHGWRSSAALAPNRW